MINTKNYKNLLIAFSCLLVINFSLVANIIAEEKKYSFEITADNGMSAYSFVDINMSLLEAYRVLDDRFFQSTDNFLIQGVGYVSRFLFSTVNSVLAHEVGGHGARIREIGHTVDKYSIGFGKGYTMFKQINNKTKWVDDYSVAIDMAGMQATHLFAEKIRSRYMEHGMINPVYGISYFESQTDQPLYTLFFSNKKQLKKFDTAYDPINYIKGINKIYGPNHITTARLKRYALLDLLDPFIYASLYSFIVNSEVGLPMITIHDTLRYVPSMRAIFAPYGAEACLCNHFLIEEDQYLRVNLSYAKKRSLQAQSYMISMKTNQVIKEGNLSFGVEAAYWNQPELLVQNRNFGKPTKGFLGIIRGELELTSNVGLIVAGGYKSKGFYIGLPIKKTVLFQGGIRFNYEI